MFSQVRISAKTDYAVRAVLELAAADDPPLKRDQIAAAQGIPVKFLESIRNSAATCGCAGTTVCSSNCDIAFTPRRIISSVKPNKCSAS